MQLISIKKWVKIVRYQKTNQFQFSATKIRSDHYLSQTLMAFSAQVKRSSEKVKSAYRTAAKSIRSETYYGRAVKAID